MILKRFTCFIAVLAGATALAAQTQPAGPDSEPMLVAEIAKSAAWGVHDNASALLTRTDLTDDEKKQIRAIIEKADATAETLAKQAGDQTVDPKITRADLNKLQTQYAIPVNDEFKKFTRSRGDLDWMSARAAGIQVIEDEAILKKNNTYLDIAKDAGIDDEHLKTIAKILDTTRSRVDTDHKLLLETYVLSKDPGERRKSILAFDGLEVSTLADARSKIRYELTNDQVAALEWEFLRQYKDIPDYAKIAFSSQIQTIKTPEDGTYVLETYPDRKQLASVKLKKGAPIGFQKAPTATKALADQKQYDLPANTLTYWIKRDPEN